MHEVLSLMQHHDAITGTHKVHVGFDYSKRMYEQRKSANVKLNQLIKNLVFDKLAVEISVPVSYCDFINSKTNRLGLCAHVDPGSLIVVYNDDLKVKRMIRL